MLKVCRVCKKEKDVSEFYKRKATLDGLYSDCKLCQSEHKKAHRLKNREAISARRKAYYRLNIDKIKKRNLAYDIAHREERRLYSKEWRKNNPEREKSNCKNTYLKNKEQRILEARMWKKNNRDKYLISSRKTSRKYAKTEKGSLSNRMRGGIRDSLKGLKKNRHWEKLVGYTVFDLKQHLEKQFTKGMSWEKLISGEIHIDHIIPISFFKFNSTDDVEFRMCWRLENLQPLWKTENLKKHNKIAMVA